MIKTDLIRKFQRLSLKYIEKSIVVVFVSCLSLLSRRRVEEKSFSFFLDEVSSAVIVSAQSFYLSSMSSIISSLVSKFFPRSSYRCLFLGLDASGKTTILYRLKLGEIVNAIPTIGFNVETVSYGAADYMLWDVGGCDKIRPLIRHYYENVDCLVHVIDSNDMERLKGAYEGWAVPEDVNEIFSNDLIRDVPLLILCNKQDLPNARSPEEIMAILGIDESKTEIRRIRCLGISCLEEVGIEEIMPAIESLIQKKSLPIVKRPISTSTPVNNVQMSEGFNPKSLESIYDEWLRREDEDDDLFLSKLDNFTLESWDHRTHLRIAYILLNRFGRRVGMKMIFEKIKAYIDHGSYISSRTTFHETMTYFWVHMVDFAVAKMRNKPHQVGELFAEEIPAFKFFLLLNPHLVNGGMYLDYYSKDLMLMNPEARVKVMLPDIKPLPSIVSSLSKSVVVVKHEHFPRSSELSDEEFYDKLKTNSLPSWGHQVKMRGLFVHLTRNGLSKNTLEELLLLFQPIERENQSVTLTYFWLHMITLYWEKAKVMREQCMPFKDFIAKTIIGKTDLLDPCLVER